MKIGIAEWCLDKSDVQALFRAADFNLSMVHIDVGRPGENNCLENKSLRKEYCEAIIESGTKISAISVNHLNDAPITGYHIESSIRENKYLAENAVDSAAEFKSELVFLPSFGKSEIHNMLELTQTAEFIQQVCDFALPKSIRIASENPLDLAMNLALIDAVNRNNFCILMDTQNPTLWHYSPAVLIRGLWHVMSKQIHFKDGVNGVMANALLGQGDADIETTVKTLHSLKYDGWIILENEYSENFETNLQQDIATIHKLFP